MRSDLNSPQFPRTLSENILFWGSFVIPKRTMALKYYNRSFSKKLSVIFCKLIRSKNIIINEYKFNFDVTWFNINILISNIEFLSYIIIECNSWLQIDDYISPSNGILYGQQ